MAAIAAPAPPAIEQKPAAAARAQVNGTWQADVTYDWDNARFSERFTFAGEADELHGSASFLGVARGVVEGRVDATRASASSRARANRAAPAAAARRSCIVTAAALAGDELRFVMQTEGASSAHVPIEFVARRVAAGASQASALTRAHGRSARRALRPHGRALRRDALGVPMRGS